MQHAACRREDLMNAFELAMGRLDRLEKLSWEAYSEASTDTPRAGYEDAEAESWDILQARLSGVSAERRSLQAEYDRRIRTVAATEVSA